MALTPRSEIAFDEDDLAPVVAEFAELSAAVAGWVNLSPEVEGGHEPSPRSTGAFLFSSRGEAVPLLTWTAPAVAGGRATVGIQHGSGPRALERLARVDLGLSDGWLRVADHPRRGLVVTSPPDADGADVLWWLLAAAHALSTVPLTGNWLATSYLPRR